MLCVDDDSKTRQKAKWERKKREDIVKLVDESSRMEMRKKIREDASPPLTRIVDPIIRCFARTRSRTLRRRPSVPMSVIKDVLKLTQPRV